jgi:uncharacterized membrane protein
MRDPSPITQKKPGQLAEAPSHTLAAPPVKPPKLAIQVIERMMTLLDALAKRSEPVSLKELS